MTAATYGFVPDSRILGRARYIYRSPSPAGGIRWGVLARSSTNSSRLRYRPNYTGVFHGTQG